MPNRWNKTYWADLGERVGATFIATLIPLYVATSNAFQLDWVTDLEISGSAAGLSLLKGLLANLADPGSGPSLLPSLASRTGGRARTGCRHPRPGGEGGGRLHPGPGYIPDPAALGSGSPSGGTLNPAARADHAEPRTLVRVIPRTDPRLGRHVEHDPRSRAFPAPATAVVVSKTWRHYGPILDQGQVGSCTGNAMAQALNTHPLHRSRTPYLTENSALALYSLATSLDDVPGTYPPDDSGSSGLAVAKAAQQKGYITAYTHAFGLDHTLAALMNGPLIVGTDWTQDMFNPDSRGFVKPTGKVAGGHEYLLLGVNVERGYATFLNSWGASFGRNGRFYMTLDDFRTLLDNGGDATQPVSA